VKKYYRGMGRDILDLYSDYLLVSTRKTTATGLSELAEGAIGHDQITRFLAGEELNGKFLWQKIKKPIRQYENGEGSGRAHIKKGEGEQRKSR
jgi:hypothetical protein